MKRISIIFLAVLLAASFIVQDAHAGKNCKRYNRHINGIEDIDFDVEDGSLFIESEEYEDEYVEITEDYKLYVNGRRVKLDGDHQKLVEEYYEQFFEITDYAKKIGLEGAKIGVHGAKIGLLAMAGVCKLMLENYDSDDLERDLEREARKLEIKAEKLEKKAELIEDMADNLEYLHEEMRDEIPALGNLGWF